MSETEAKTTGNAEWPGIRVVEVIAAEIEIDPENPENITYPQGIFPIHFFVGRYKGDVGWAVEGDVLIGKVPPNPP